MKKSFSFLLFIFALCAIAVVSIDAVASVSVNALCFDSLPAFVSSLHIDPVGFSMAGVMGVATRPGSRPGSGYAMQQTGPQVQTRGTSIMIPGMRHIFTDPSIAQSMNMMQIPDSVTILVASGAAGVSTRVFVLNQDLLNNVTDNGSGANSITYTYADGFAGRLVSNLLAQDRAAMGACCFGVTLRIVTTASGAGNPSGLAATNPYFANFNAYGNTTALNMNMASNQTRMDQDTSIEVVPVAQNLGRFQQFSFIIPVLSTATCVLYLTNNYTI